MWTIDYQYNIYDFSVDHNAIDKFDMLTIPKYIMVKNDIN